jgi:diaminohydroxyphosphoribosylaminopyrimidine deaminase/5-amino-6-(5-phosphoribosylamino)uracil reductase
VVLDPAFRISPHLKMFGTARRVPILVLGAAGGVPPAYPDGVETRQVPAGPDGRLDLDAVLGSLARDGVTRVLVEAGPTIASALLAADLVDEVVIARGTEPLGANGRQPFGDRGLEVLDDAARWQPAERRLLGADTLTVHRRAGRL